MKFWQIYDNIASEYLDKYLLADFEVEKQAHTHEGSDGAVRCNACHLTLDLCPCNWQRLAAAHKRNATYFFALAHTVRKIVNE